MSSSRSVNITGHMIIKNEDRWIWFAICSILPFVDSLLIYDTGSTDKTIDIIKSFKSKKIIFSQHHIKSRNDLSLLRQKQIDETKTDWFWVIDGDEIYPRESAKEVVEASKKNYAAIAVRRYDLLGDIYHHQKESVGSYNLYGKTGHLVTRLINLKKVKGLHVSGDYPLEGYFDSNNISTQKLARDKVYITKDKLYHTMYLRRSSMNDKSIFNRGKYKIETGIKISGSVPEVFYKSYPSIVSNPLKKRGFLYELLALFITPIKNIKRKLVV